MAALFICPVSCPNLSRTDATPTVLMVKHALSLVAPCNFLVVIRNGQKEEEEKKTDLAKQNKIDPLEMFFDTSCAICTCATQQDTSKTEQDNNRT